MDAPLIDAMTDSKICSLGKLNFFLGFQLLEIYAANFKLFIVFSRHFTSVILLKTRGVPHYLSETISLNFSSIVSL